MEMSRRNNAEIQAMLTFTHLLEDEPKSQSFMESVLDETKTSLLAGRVSSAQFYELMLLEATDSREKVIDTIVGMSDELQKKASSTKEFMKLYPSAVQDDMVRETMLKQISRIESYLWALTAPPSELQQLNITDKKLAASIMKKCQVAGLPLQDTFSMLQPNTSVSVPKRV